MEVGIPAPLSGEKEPKWAYIEKQLAESDALAEVKSLFLKIPKLIYKPIFSIPHL